MNTWMIIGIALVGLMIAIIFVEYGLKFKKLLHRISRWMRGVD